MGNPYIDTVFIFILICFAFLKTFTFVSFIYSCTRKSAIFFCLSPMTSTTIIQSNWRETSLSKHCNLTMSIVAIGKGKNQYAYNKSSSSFRSENIKNTI